MFVSYMYCLHGHRHPSGTKSWVEARHRWVRRKIVERGTDFDSAMMTMKRLGDQKLLGKREVEECGWRWAEPSLAYACGSLRPRHRGTSKQVSSRFRQERRGEDMSPMPKTGRHAMHVMLARILATPN